MSRRDVPETLSGPTSWDCFGCGRRGCGRGPGAGGGGRGRGRMFDNGDLRLVVMQLLSERPRHGYEIIKALEERVGGGYSPSPGVVYPTLTLLEELGHASVTDERAGRKLYTLTPDGRARWREPACGGRDFRTAGKRRGLAQRPAAAGGAGDGKPRRRGAVAAARAAGRGDADPCHHRGDRCGGAGRRRGLIFPDLSFLFTQIVICETFRAISARRRHDPDYHYRQRLRGPHDHSRVAAAGRRCRDRGGLAAGFADLPAEPDLGSAGLAHGSGPPCATGWVFCPASRHMAPGHGAAGRRRWPACGDQHR